MSQQIRIFEKNKIDLSNPNITLTVTDAIALNNGQAFVDFVRNRNNKSAWLTTGSTDAANTTIEGDMLDEWVLSDVLFIGHNFKNFTFKYWNNSMWNDFNPAINETVNTDSVSHFAFAQQAFSKFQLKIYGTQTPDADKILKQLIVTSRIGSGQFEGWPLIKKPELGLNKKKATMLSGKVNVIEGTESFSVSLQVKNWKSNADLSIVEDIHFKRHGVLVWPGGGDEAQFSSVRRGYRKEDIFLMRAVNEWRPEWVSGLYKTGLNIKVDLEEAVN